MGSLIFVVVDGRKIYPVPSASNLSHGDVPSRPAPAPGNPGCHLLAPNVIVRDSPPPPGSTNPCLRYRDRYYMPIQSDSLYGFFERDQVIHAVGVGTGGSEIVHLVYDPAARDWELPTGTVKPNLRKYLVCSTNRLYAIVNSELHVANLADLVPPAPQGYPPPLAQASTTAITPPINPTRPATAQDAMELEGEQNQDVEAVRRELAELQQKYDELLRDKNFFQQFYDHEQALRTGSPHHPPQVTDSTYCKTLEGRVESLQRELAHAQTLANEVPSLRAQLAQTQAARATEVASLQPQMERQRQELAQALAKQRSDALEFTSLREQMARQEQELQREIDALRKDAEGLIHENAHMRAQLTTASTVAGDGAMIPRGRTVAVVFNVASQQSACMPILQEILGPLSVGMRPYENPQDVPEGSLVLYLGILSTPRIETACNQARLAQARQKAGHLVMVLLRVGNVAGAFGTWLEDSPQYPSGVLLGTTREVKGLVQVLVTTQNTLLECPQNQANTDRLRGMFAAVMPPPPPPPPPPKRNFLSKFLSIF
ncbi:hypothetical protein PAPYR_7806 [Paratrimastix pyriformis]|uniref:Uncharacterized protein n=1 Tax=Paratrimastix pyriformis TaxID=342808 RepID=A0ABQ8UC66_9EUKA|nr:hypothetical protein PAPYR_7806 [Paratrimastix pyriformis]